MRNTGNFSSAALQKGTYRITFARAKRQNGKPTDLTVTSKKDGPEEKHTTSIIGESYSAGAIPIVVWESGAKELEREQLWFIEPAGAPDTYTIKNDATGLFISVDRADAEANPSLDPGFGLRVVGLPKNNKLNQKWIILAAKNPKNTQETIYKFCNAANLKGSVPAFLDLNLGNVANGTAIEGWSGKWDFGNSHQGWFITPVETKKVATPAAATVAVAPFNSWSLKDGIYHIVHENVKRKDGHRVRLTITNEDGEEGHPITAASRFGSADKFAKTDWKRISTWEDNAEGKESIQKWKISHVAGKPDTYTIFNEKNGLYLTLGVEEHADIRSGVALTGQPPNGKDTQEWIISRSPPGSQRFKIRSVAQPAFLDIKLGDSRNGTTVEAWDGTWENTNSHQYWLFEHVKSPKDELLDAAGNLIKALTQNIATALSEKQSKDTENPFDFI